jgi:hypothetical protein
MSDIQVTCIIREARNNTHEGITHLGGAGWKLTRSEVIRLIENHTNTYYTRVGEIRADLAVILGRYGKYLRTHQDGVWNDNLLLLETCY